MPAQDPFKLKPPPFAAGKMDRQETIDNKFMDRCEQNAYSNNIDVVMHTMGVVTQVVSTRRVLYYDIKDKNAKLTEALRISEEKSESRYERLGSLRGVVAVLASNASKFGLAETINRLRYYAIVPLSARAAAARHRPAGAAAGAADPRCAACACQAAAAHGGAEAGRASSRIHSAACRADARRSAAPGEGV